jgi:LacI family transcriptional regulator
MRRQPKKTTGDELPMLDPSRAVTLDDVARLSGFSPATVTRALNGNPRVRPDTRERVEKAANDLGYLPHLGARALATRTSQTIGLLIPSSGDSFWGGVAAGLEERAIEEGFSTLLAASHGDAERERRMIELFLGKRVDGIVIVSAAGMPTAWFPRGPSSIPVVLVDWDMPFEAKLVAAACSEPVSRIIDRIHRRTAETPFRHVCTDDVDGAVRVVRHLLKLGHRDIAFAGMQPIRPSLLRLLGVRRALDEENLSPTMVIECPASLEGGQSAGLRILESPRRPTAVVAFDDMVGVGILRAVHAAGLRVPRDLSVTGFDDVEIAAFVEPPLTTVGQAKQALGSLAVDQILGQLRGTRDEVSTLLPGELVVRQSTGEPPKHRGDTAAATHVSRSLTD